MSKFRVGNRVRVLNSMFSNFHDGDVGIIVEVDSSSAPCLVELPERTVAQWFQESALELVQQEAKQDIVDRLYAMLTEGEKQHMANKLWKHGYRSPKAFCGKVVDINGVDYRLVRDGE